MSYKPPGKGSAQTVPKTRTNGASFVANHPYWSSNTTEQQQYTNIGTPITSLTPLQFIPRNPNFEIVFIDDLTPISHEEMPP
jgi:hypothetical protein